MRDQYYFEGADTQRSYTATRMPCHIITKQGIIDFDTSIGICISPEYGLSHTSSPSEVSIYLSPGRSLTYYEIDDLDD